MLVEACAGFVETGDAPAETVRKEAAQELGYRLREPREVFPLYMSRGASAEIGDAKTVGLRQFARLNGV